MRHVHYDECLVFSTRDTCFTFSLVVGVGPATNDSRHMPVGYCGCPALGSSRPCTDVRERLNHLDVSKPSSISWPVPTDPRGARPEDKPGQGEKVLFLFVQSGAAGGYRTYDLSLTKGVLYH